ncbi:MAG: HAMP domain-containing protein [Clostridia bacterium]|nr:HAMP domain-containing protein [Clostridia bacterium]MBQ4157926.1 HAMP domain-containing protein [Clostridia bacterium]
MRKGKDNRRVFGIFPKMLISYTVIIVIVFGMACGITFHLVRNYIIESNRMELLEKAVELSKEQNWFPELQVFKRYQELLDAEIVFIGTDYTAVQAPLPRRGGSRMEPLDEDKFSYTRIASQMDKDIITSIFQGNGVSGVENVEFLTAQVVYAGVPVFSPNEELIGAMMLFRLLDDVTHIWTTITLYFLIAAGAAVTAALFFAAIFTKSFTKPLYQMNDAACSMAAGDYTKRVPVRSQDEIGQLANTFNVLSVRLQEVIRELENEKSRFETILLSIAEGIVAFSRDGNVMHYNPSALEYLEIEKWDAENAEEKKKQVSSMLAIAMDSGQMESSSWTSESGRIILALASPIIDKNRMIVGAVCLLRDISEEARLEQLRREYIANVSHELRTPLTGIRGMAEPLIDGILETEEEKQDCYQVIYKESLRLEKLIGEMLDLSRLQDGRVIIEIERVDLENAVESAVMATKRLADEAGIDIACSIQDKIACMGNEDRIIQVLVILIDNAISFTPAGGKIWVSAEEDGNKAVLTVRDTGVGIEPQHIPYIWERFYKADKSRMRTTGTGLGLAIAKRAVELMNGRIGVSSEPGKGAEFTIVMNIG